MDSRTRGSAPKPEQARRAPLPAGSHRYRSLAMAVCSQCGTASEPLDDDAPLGWMLEVDARTARRSVTCPVCARANVRAIEGKLDQAWW